MIILTKTVNFKTILLFILLSFLINPAQHTYAQKAEKLIVKADKYYDHGSFSKALTTYLKAEKKVGFEDELYVKIGRCYEKTADYPNADTYYSQLFYKSKTVDPAYFIEYGTLLMKMGKNDEARSYFSSYNNLMEKNDTRALKYIESIEDYDKFFLDSAFIDVEKMGTNTDGSELNPIFYSGKLYYASNKKHKSSTPFEFDIYSTSDLTSLDKPIKIKGQGTVKGRLDGFTIAKSTGEFLFIIFDYETKSSVLYRSFINDEGDEITKPEKIPLGSFADRVLSPTVNKDGSILIFSSDSRNGLGGWDLFISTRNSYGYSEPKLLEGFINSLGDEKFPYLLNDTLLFFASNGQGGVGGADLFFTNLNKPTAFPKNLGFPINSRYDESGILAISGNIFGYLVSERSQKNSFNDLFRFELKHIRGLG